MGVAGLWDILQHTAETRSLTHLAVVDGFEKNASGHRGYRIGIDASIWFFHAKSGREGENPELRLIFFRLAKLLSEPFLPLFVFDGPKRPAWKRGIQISKKPHWMIHGVKTMINAFGFEWRQAPGEAEAELAYLNRINVIDGILSDDVDNFLFGAQVVIRNPGRGLTGNIGNPALNSEGKDDGNHVRIFHATTLESDEKIGLTRAGFILIGLLSGGDYEEKEVPGSKLPGCGIVTAHALARSGFGDELVHAVGVLPPDELDEYLGKWREALREELRTNSRKLLSRKEKKLADSITGEFPNLKVLRAYVQPVTTESEAIAKEGRCVSPKIHWSHEHSLAQLARFCEEKFEWGTKVIVPRRFRSLLWHGAVIRIIRRAALDLDEGTSRNGPVMSKEKPLPQGQDLVPPSTPRKRGKSATANRVIGTPSKMITKYFSTLGLNSPTKEGMDEDHDENGNALIAKIASSTTSHASSDYILEYRVEIDPTQLINLTESGIQGDRDEPEDGLFAAEDENEVDADGKKVRRSKPVDPFSRHRIWVPASMLAMVEPELVEDFETADELKKQKKAKKASGSQKTSDKPAPNVARVPRSKKAAPKKSLISSSGEEETIDLGAVVDSSESETEGPIRAKPSSQTRRSITPPSKKVPTVKKNDASRATVSLAGPSSKSAMLPPVKKSSRQHSIVRTESNAEWDALFPSTSPPSLSPIKSPPRPHQQNVPLRGASSRVVSRAASPSKRRTAVLGDEEENEAPGPFSTVPSSSSVPLPKSPRKAKEQTSPHKDNNILPLKYSWLRPDLSSSEEDNDDPLLSRRSPSPSPMKSAVRRPLPLLKTRPLTSREIIELSDSDDEPRTKTTKSANVQATSAVSAPPSRLPPKKLSQQPSSTQRRTTPASRVVDVIDLTTP